MKRKKRSNPQKNGKTLRQLEQEMYNCIVPMDGSDVKPYPIEQFRKDLNKSIDISKMFTGENKEFEGLIDKVVKSLENLPPDQLKEVERIEENLSKYIVDDDGNPMTKDDIKRLHCKTLVLSSLGF
jgi:hypothetical protein